MGAVRQHARLSVGVAAVGGGVLLLASNAAYMVVADAALSLVPLAANAALIFGGVMFLREWRRLGR